MSISYNISQPISGPLSWPLTDVLGGVAVFPQDLSGSVIARYESGEDVTVDKWGDQGIDGIRGTQFDGSDDEIRVDGAAAACRPEVGKTWRYKSVLTTNRQGGDVKFFSLGSNAGIDYFSIGINSLGRFTIFVLHNGATSVNLVDSTSVFFTTFKEVEFQLDFDGVDEWVVTVDGSIIATLTDAPTSIETFDILTFGCRRYNGSSDQHCRGRQRNVEIYKDGALVGSFAGVGKPDPDWDDAVSGAASSEIGSPANAVKSALGTWREANPALSQVNVALSTDAEDRVCIEGTGTEWMQSDFGEAFSTPYVIALVYQLREEPDDGVDFTLVDGLNVNARQQVAARRHMNPDVNLGGSYINDQIPEYWDDYERADTAAGVLSDAESGQAYIIRSSVGVGAGPTDIQIINGEVTSVMGETVYWGGDFLSGDCTKIGARIKWFSNPGDSSRSVFLFLVGGSAWVTDILHVGIMRRNITFDVGSAGSFVELGSYNFDPWISKDEWHNIEMRISGDTATVSVDGVDYLTVQDSRIASFNGSDVFWEKFFTLDNFDDFTVERTWAQGPTINQDGAWHRAVVVGNGATSQLWIDGALITEADAGSDNLDGLSLLADYSGSELAKAKIAHLSAITDVTNIPETVSKMNSYLVNKF
jgi:hypothetical protein